jgi:hypothetical protein
MLEVNGRTLMTHENLELEKKIYKVAIDDNIVSFTIYGEEDDLEALEMFIAFLLQGSNVDVDDIDEDNE